MPAFHAPIAGQSLTAEPKGHPWERPPEISDPEEAIQMHLTRLSEPDMLESVLSVLEDEEIDIATLTKGILRVRYQKVFIVLMSASSLHLSSTSTSSRPLSSLV